MDLDFKFGLIDCPICSSKMKAIHQIKDIPHFGETVIFTLTCPTCHHRSSDLFAVEEKEPVKYILHYSNPKQLRHKVIRSSTCYIKIPELGVEIDPSSASEGYFTNVEGVLQRIKDILLGLLRSLETDEEINNANLLIQKIEASIDGKFNFALILEDKKGNSAILPDFEDTSIEKQPCT